MSPWRVLRTIRKAEYLELITLFFLQGAALGIWFVPLSNVLDAHGLQSIKPYAFASSALAAFISPLIFGAMADRHASPVKVLRGLSLATAAARVSAAAGDCWKVNPDFPNVNVDTYTLTPSPSPIRWARVVSVLPICCGEGSRLRVASRKTSNCTATFQFLWLDAPPRENMLVGRNLAETKFAQANAATLMPLSVSTAHRWEPNHN